MAREYIQESEQKTQPVTFMAVLRSGQAITGTAHSSGFPVVQDDGLVRLAEGTWVSGSELTYVEYG